MDRVDRFAAAALTGILSTEGCDPSPDESLSQYLDHVAAHAMLFGLAMERARQRLIPSAHEACCDSCGDILLLDGLCPDCLAEVHDRLKAADPEDTEPACTIAQKILLNSRADLHEFANLGRCPEISDSPSPDLAGQRCVYELGHRGAHAYYSPDIR